MALALCLTLLPATAQAEDGHASHPICGKTCSHTGQGETPHPNEAFQDAKWMASYTGQLGVEKSSTSSSGKLLDEDGDYVILTTGYYYLSTTADNCDHSYVKSYKPIKIQGDVTICLNGNQIQKAGSTTGPVFEVPSDCTLTLTDCKVTGQIVCNDSSNGSGVYVNGGTLNLYSGQISNGTGQKDTGSENTYGGGVYVTGIGTFNMYGGVITGNSANYGGGVYVKSGTFTMYGGTIKSNRSSKGYGTDSSGAGVCVEESGNFIMKNDASVTANMIGWGSTAGAGVYVNGGTFEMHDNASVTGNEAGNTDSKGNSGCGVYVNGGTFTMHGSSKVTGNKATSGNALSGGGVYVKSGTFTMNDNSKVTENTASGKKGSNGNGGGVYVEGGTFEMNGKAKVMKNAVSGANNSDGHGGGVYVEGGKFDMNGEETSVSNNTASDNGGGVYSRGTFTMNSSTASVTDNTADQGGGVYASSGTFTMSGGHITGNHNNGVFVHENATFTVSGAPTVTGNTMRGAAGNVFLAGYQRTITIGKAGLNGSPESIGVTIPYPNENSVIATGANGDYNGIFFIDDKRYVVKREGDKLVLKKEETPTPDHTHSWTYTVNGATIKATCKIKGCNAPDGGSVTITAPTDLTYNGQGKTAEVTVSDDWQGPAKNEITITYWKSVDGGNTYTNLDGVVPTEVGKYKARITVDGKTAFVVYEITKGSAPAKREQDQLNLASDKNTIAVGETLKLTVTGGSGTGKVVYQALGDGSSAARIDGNVLTADKAGKVTVKAVKNGDETFKEAVSNTITITITEPEKPKPEPKPEPSQPSNPGGGSSSGGSSSSDRDSYDSNPVIKTETKNHPDGSTTKTETRKDGSVTQTTTAKDGSTSKTETKKDGSSVTETKAADGSTGTVKTDKNGQTEAKTALSNKAVEDAKRNGEAVKAPVEVEASRNSNTAPTVKVELPKNSGETKVEIPVSNVKSGTVAVIVHPDGTEEILKDSIPTKDGIRLAVDGNATVKIVDNSKDFVDTRNHWAREEIDFVSARELVNGMTATRYAPDATATRAQLWTILARQNDADLTGGANWYEKAQLWSKDKGISDGTQPDAAINRAQMVTMLWRTMGQPAAGGAANFNDVPANSYYAQAVAWAVEGGITQGVGGGRFDPAATCTRAQIATFLARSMK